MNRITRISTIVFAGLCFALSAAAESKEILLDQLGSPQEDVHSPALQAFLNQGSSAIGVLSDQIGGENQVREKFAKQAIETMVNQASRPGAKTERQSVEKELIFVILGKGSAASQNFALAMLARLGDESAVPAIAAHLYRTETQEMACYALENISCPSAGEALLKALSLTICPKFQAALIKTLGAKEYAPAYKAIRKAMKSKDYELSLAAIGAMGRLAHPDSLKPLFEIYMDSYGRAFWASAEALLATADGLVEKGDPYRPRYIYMAFWQPLNPPWLRCAALRGYVKLDGKGAWPRLMEAINGDDMMARGTARELLLGLTEGETSLLLVNAVKNASGVARLELARLLAERKDISTGSAAPVLVGYLEDRDFELKTAAAKALIQIPGDEVSKTILAALDDSKQTQKPELIRILGERGYHGAIFNLRKIEKNGNEETQKAATEALGKIK